VQKGAFFIIQLIYHQQIKKETKKSKSSNTTHHFTKTDWFRLHILAKNK